MGEEDIPVRADADRPRVQQQWPQRADDVHGRAQEPEPEPPQANLRRKLKQSAEKTNELKLSEGASGTTASTAASSQSAPRRISASETHAPGEDGHDRAQEFAEVRE